MPAQPHLPVKPDVADEVAVGATARASPGLEGLLGVALAAAGVLLGMQSVLMALFARQNVWQTSWVIAAVFMGPVVLHWPSLFDLAAITAAIAALYPSSLVCVLILFGVVHRVGVKWAVLTGALVGLLIFCVDLYGLTWWFPWLAAERNWMAGLSHLVFGGVTAWRLGCAGEKLG